MISLKRHIESNRDELLNRSLGCYRSCLAATAAFGVRACPNSVDFQQNLLALQQRLSGDVTPDLLAGTQQVAEQQLKDWGDCAEQYLKSKASELRDLMIFLAQAAAAVGDRDQRYGGEFTAFSSRLRAIADFDDVGKMRTSVVQSATQLTACVEKMENESKQCVAQLQAELSVYQARLEETERLASRDSLTGLFNRRRIEAELEERIHLGRTFTVMLLDLNKFKPINDELGHEAGDEVLKQFAAEVKSVFRTADIVGRWGGDEFLIILDGPILNAEPQVTRIRRWVCGEYNIQNGSNSRKVTIDVAIGLAAWNQGETMKDLLNRADQAMYRDKRRRPQSLK